MRTLRLQILMTLLAAFMVGSGFGEKKNEFHYRLKAQIDPAFTSLKQK